MNEEAVLKKSGEVAITVSFDYSLKGIRVSVKTLPVVEEYFRNRAGDRQEEVTNFGRYWVRDADQHSLRFWYCIDDLPDHYVSDRGRYGLVFPGQQLVMGRNEEATLNLSYLSLVGIGEGAGVSFNIREVVSPDGLVEIRDKTASALRHFYLSNLRPVKYTVSVHLQEI